MLWILFAATKAVAPSGLPTLDPKRVRGWSLDPVAILLIRPVYLVVADGFIVEKHREKQYMAASKGSSAELMKFYIRR